MKRLAVVLSIAVLSTGCAPGTKDIDRVQAGMDRDQVREVIGPPDSVAQAAGRECAYYTLLKDFWSRVPWSMSDRYYVCFDNGKVESFGKADAMGSAPGNPRAG